MKKILVTKYSGIKEPYDQEKVVNSILRAGVKRETVPVVLAKVESQLYDGISTDELYRLVGEQLAQKVLPDNPHLYHLREALALMGSIDFEKFIREFLEKEGYRSRWNVIVPGFCIEHQVDVMVETPSGQKLMVEVKQHRRFHRDCDLGTTVEVWGRLDDLQKGFAAGKNQENFAAACLITNTKFSAHAKQYAACKGLRLLGWRFNSFDTPKTEGLEEKIKQIGFETVDRMIRKIINQSRT